MGNYLGCMGSGKKKKTTKKMSVNGGMRRTRGSLEDELMMEQQALAHMALHPHHHEHKGAQLLRFDSSSNSLSSLHRDHLPATVTTTAPPRRSYSGKPSSSSKLEYTRSSSTRPRHSSDLLLDPQQLLNCTREAFLAATLESKHFVLVHGGGLGAWCWYKSIALLEESGFVATAVDLAGSGIEPTEPNQIKSLAQYVKPLVELLENLSGTEKVILVGHNIGGACISFAMESFPHRIAKAIFVTASMVCNGQRAFDVFAKQEKSADDLMPKAQRFIYGNGTSTPPTAVELDKSLVRDLFFNVSPAKDVALATVSMRPIPFAPAMEKITLTAENYGCVRRFFVETTEDHALSPAAQCNMINQNPPEQVFTLKGSDHSPFFSKPQSLHKIFLEIAQLDAKE
ncbi:unnamed protein product [Sphagnum troendelagicum]|uniref:AB hydrolase-1 domain-containing protein n=1 Tax=Sphagnum troendelagicum TaxID=128251 RepID=A0ABP0UCK0_9BRYO